jgi:hypothetical protein
VQLSVPIKDLPPLLTLPEFKEPGILVDAPIGVPFFNQLKLMSGDAKSAQIKYGGVISVEYKFNIHAFLRLLAKIAHSMAIATYGVDIFEPFLPDIILGKRPELAGYLIGQSLHFQSMHELAGLPRNKQRHLVYFRRDLQKNLIASRHTTIFCV